MEVSQVETRIITHSRETGEMTTVALNVKTQQANVVKVAQVGDTGDWKPTYLSLSFAELDAICRFREELRRKGPE